MNATNSRPISGEVSKSELDDLGGALNDFFAQEGSTEATISVSPSSAEQVMNYLSGLGKYHPRLKANIGLGNTTRRSLRTDMYIEVRPMNEGERGEGDR
jgi:hypothetical protein